MTEKQWLECADPALMLEFLREKVSDRKLRLLAVACCRRVWHLLTDDRRNVVEVAERFADGNCSSEELELARHSPLAPAGANYLSRCAATAAFAVTTWYDDPDDVYHHLEGGIIPADRIEQAMLVAEKRAQAAAAWRAATEVLAAAAAALTRTEPQTQAELVQEIFGNPFRPVTFAPAWRTSTVLSLAQSIYDERQFQNLPILADALEDAGCDHADILAHCRQPGEHVRGCWVLDLVLGKE